MSERPFLLYVTRDEENKHVVKVQGPGVPLMEKRMTIAEFVHLSFRCNEAVLEMLAEEKRQNRGLGDVNS